MDDATLHLCTCDARHCRLQRESRRQRTVEPPASSALSPPTPGHFFPQLTLAVCIEPRHESVAPLHHTPTLALGDATTPAGAASTPRRTTVCGPQKPPCVGEPGCQAYRASAMAARLAIEREAAAQLQLLKKGGLAATPSSLCTAAEPQQHPLDANLRLLATGGVAAPLSPMPATEPRVVPSCQKFRDGPMAGNYDCDADKLVLEAIANAILLRSERQEIRLRHKNGRVHIYTMQLMPRKSQIKTRQIKQRRGAARRLNLSDGEWSADGTARTDAARAWPRASLCGRAGGPYRRSVNEPYRFQSLGKGARGGPQRPC